MMRKTRGAAIAAFGMSIAMLAAGCSGGDEAGGSTEEGGDVSLTMWHNSTTGPGKGRFSPRETTSPISWNVRMVTSAGTMPHR